MSTEQKSQTFYKLSLYRVQKGKDLTVTNSLVSERIFDSSVYGYQNNIDIRDIAYSFIKTFTKVLSKPRKKLTFEYGQYDLLKDFDKYYPNVSNDELAHFKYVLSIKNHCIIERNFTVENFVPESTFSIELTDALDSIVSDIQNNMKNRDIEHLYNFFADQEKKKYWEVINSTQLADSIKTIHLN